VNELLGLLERNGPPTVQRLKRLYRRLTKKAHPDLTRESHEAFVRLHRSYEEALRLLSQPAQPRQTAPPGSKAGKRGQGPEIPLRLAVLKTLYRYALKFNGVETQGVFATLLELAKQYRSDVHADLLTYEKIFLQTYGAWRGDGTVYYAHGLWIACIRELAYYLSFGQARYLTLLKAYRKDLAKRSERLRADQGQNLRRLGQWLLEEAHGEKIQIVLEA